MLSEMAPKIFLRMCRTLRLVSMSKASQFY